MGDRVTREDVDELGWNSPEHDNPVLTARINAAQLHLLGRLLLEIRDALTESPSDG